MFRVLIKKGKRELKKPKYFTFLIPLIILSIFIPSAHTGSNPVKFEVIKDFPDVMYAGSYYEAEFHVENYRSVNIEAGINITICGPDLVGGEFQINMTFNDIKVELEEVQAGVFNHESFTIPNNFEGNLIVGVYSVPNIKPANYTLQINLYAEIGEETFTPSFPCYIYVIVACIIVTIISIIIILKKRTPKRKNVDQKHLQKRRLLKND